MITNTVYDRIEIIVSGLERLTARPIEFEYDPTGNPIKVMRYESTCPACGNMIIFSPGDIIKRGGKDHVICNNCHVDAYDEFDVKGPDIRIKQTGQEVVKNDKPVPVCPFVDPIEIGIFDSLELNFGK